MNILIKVDSSIIIGTGHVMRCRNLANKFKERGYNVIFICKVYEGNIISILNEDYDVLEISNNYLYPLSINTNTWLGDNIEDDVDKCFNVYNNIYSIDKQIDLLIIDHYAIDYRWEELIKQRLPIKSIMVIDDLHNRKHNCDYLLDHTYRTNNPYKSLVSNDTCMLLGPSYCLLNDMFMETRNKKQRNEMTRIDKQIKRINISFGGGDMYKVTEKVIKTIINCDDDNICNEIKYDIVLGKLYPNIEKIKQLVKDKKNFNVYVNINHREICNLLIDTDLGIGAGGTSVYERCCLGIPSIVITMADNQKSNAINLDDLGAITYLGNYDKWDEKELIKIIRIYDKKIGMKERQCNICSDLVKGDGCNKVIDIIINKLKE